MSVLFLLACGPPPVEPAPPGTEVVVVLIDTLRADAVAGFGAEPEASPFLQRLGDDGVRCSSAWSTSSWTAPSTASLFTSRYPPQIGVVTGMMAMQKLGEPFEMNRIPRSLETLAERFQAAGYQTVGLASNPNIGSDLGFSDGFDHFVDDPDASIEDLAAELKKVPRATKRFTYLHLNDVHAPYEPGWRWKDGAKTPKELYEAELRYTDHHLGELYETMGWQDDVVVVLADHGEEFFEHGARGHDALSLHREVTQVPMIWQVPGGSGVVDEPVSLIDVLPTLTELAGLDEDLGWEGTSLVAALGGAALPARSIYHHRRREKPGQAVQEIWGVTDAEFRYLRTTAPGELFAMTDALEQEDLGSSMPEPAALREARLVDFERSAPVVERDAVELKQTEAEAEMLRRLGYIE